MRYFATLDYYDICLIAFCIFEAYVIYKLLKKKKMETEKEPEMIQVTMNEKLVAEKISEKTITVHEPHYFGSCIVRNQQQLDKLIADLKKISEKKFFDVQ